MKAVLDIGTTGVKTLVFDDNEKVLSRVYLALDKKVSGAVVEQDPVELVEKSKEVLRLAIKEAKVETISSLRITNQRETVIAWDKTTSQAITPAIVWEDTRTKEFCDNLRPEFQEVIRNKTGLSLDAYFSATKIRWILDNVLVAKELLAEDKLAVGTVDSWILWNILEGNPHITDDTNASRTLLYNIHDLVWDDELLDIFSIPKKILPEVRRSISNFGMIRSDILSGNVSVKAVCGDQQASMYAAGIDIGSTKVTFGTGTFIMQVIGEEFAVYDDFFTTLVPGKDGPLYAVEAKISRGGKEVEPLIGKEDELRSFLVKLSLDVADIVRRLPISPTKITVDGGITRARCLPGLIAEDTKAKIVEHNIFDGTALGMARM